MIQATTRELLRAWRRYYRLPQRKAAIWLYVPHGTYRDYEQGRSEPNNITRRGIEALIGDYGTEYVRYFFEQEGQIVFAFDPDLDLDWDRE
jgi:predicted transcriptional regulator